MFHTVGGERTSESNRRSTSLRRPPVVLLAAGTFTCTRRSADASACAMGMPRK